MKLKHNLLFSVFLLIVVFSFFITLVNASKYEVESAPDFTATDQHGVEFNLSDYQGKIVILHFTQLEEPVCIECLKEMKGQIVALENLVQFDQNVTVITVNIRQNPYSVSGKAMAERDFDVNVSWHWVEDFSPYPVAGLYQKYWTAQGAFSNPGLILIDINQHIVGVYHVYLMGKGPIDGIQSAESLTGDVEDIIDGRWEGFKGQVQDDSVTFIGMFILGILTALSPCSIALLVAMISYVGSLQQDSEKSNKKISIQGIWVGIVFTIGMALVFFVFGLILSSISIFIEASALFYLIAGIVLVVLGINIFKPLRELVNVKTKQERNSQLMEKGQKIFFKLSKTSIYLGAFFLGILFSIGWAPCAMGLMMPVFILTLTQEISILMTGLLLFVFGLGHGVPIIPLCAVTNTVRGKLGNNYVKAGKWMQWIFGIIIIIIGIIMAARFWGINLW
ncbi:MAG: cytochrome c biogenesis protein CcdA [Candidatus Thermoplasmatota archaeon]|nr:cytochrome c biogenesis protein CcdA [Candidatus Thermoplasmatota archaeon]